MAGTVTITEERLGTVKKVTFAWTSAAGGAADGTTTYPYTGKIQSVVTVPGTAGVTPDDNYDVVLLDGDSVDVGNGQLANRSQTLTQTVSASLGNVVGDLLTLGVTNAGNAKSGTVIVYIGQADSGSAVQASIGSPTNTGGTATIAGILGDPANVSLATSISKIAGASAGGLLATADSLAYGIGEIERHFHGWDRWMCAAAAANGEIHVADRVGSTSTAAFTLTSGNDTWGNWVQVLGSSDTPVVAGGVKYDLHRILVLVANTVAPYFIQVAFGTTGAAALAANTFSSIVINPSSNTDKTEALPMMCRRQAAGTKAWARCWCVGNNAKTLTIMFGLHEYEG